MTIKELADSIGLSEATVSRYEKGSIEPKRDTVAVIARKFGVNPAWLIGYEGAAKYLNTKPVDECECVYVPIGGAKQNVENVVGATRFELATSTTPR